MNNTTSSVRVRFAPSPTGYLHVGGLRTALYNYLFARRNNGAFLVRIEDTDQTRSVEGAIENILDALRWCGLEFDEGPGKDGGCGPYIQSQRLETYAAHAKQLVESGAAYYCFCTPERLETVRRQMQAQKLPPMYDRHCRTLTETEVRDNLNNGVAHVIRLKVPIHEEIAFNDVIHGAMKVQGHVLDDQVLMKSDGFPTYHLANIVDDHLMGITHVIRGDEWLPSTPKHILLYRAFGWQPPLFAHLPLLLNPDRSKLSKRQGDVAVEDYRAKGFLPEALVNFVALLGWNPTGERELYPLEELIAQFDLERVNKAGAVFDVKKLLWMNAQYIRMKDDNTLAAQLQSVLAKNNITAEPEYIARAVHLLKDRVETLNDFAESSDFLFHAPHAFDEAYMRKHWNDSTPVAVADLAERFTALTDFSHESIERTVREYAESTGVKPAALIHPLRLALTGKGVGPGLFELIAVLGREETVARLNSFLEIQQK